MNLNTNTLQALTLVGISLTVWVHESSSQSQSEVHGTIHIERSEFHQEPFKSRYFGEGDWQGTLAMDITYAPIKRIRGQIEADLYSGGSLQFLTAWEAEGEAHVTTITPVEYQECMWSRARGIEILHMKDIEKIAIENKIQASDLDFQGMGFGEKNFAGREGLDQTHFVIVTSRNLLKIRQEIYNRYIEKGGQPECWRPERFYPHITVGYTYKDIHYPDVEKNLENSFDDRFRFEIKDSDTRFRPLVKSI